MKKHGYGEDGVYNGNNPEYARNEPVTLDGAKIREAAEKFCIADDIREEALKNPVCYEDPEKTTNVSIDDVNVKRQRRKPSKRCEI